MTNVYLRLNHLSTILAQVQMGLSLHESEQICVGLHKSDEVERDQADLSEFLVRDLVDLNETEGI